MSRYSGKCDFYDAIEINELESYSEDQLKVYCKGKEVPKKDWPKYYGHIVSSMFLSRNTGGTIYLTKEPYFKSRERSHAEIMGSAILAAIAENHYNHDAENIRMVWKSICINPKDDLGEYLIKIADKINWDASKVNGEDILAMGYSYPVVDMYRELYNGEKD